MGKVVGVLWNEPFKILLKVDASRVIGIFEDHKAGARVLDEHGSGTVGDAALDDGGINLVGDLVSSLALGWDLQRLRVHLHSLGLTPHADLINRLSAGTTKSPFEL